jgi:hypothetical protein
LNEKTLPFAGQGFSILAEVKRPWHLLLGRKRIVKLMLMRSIHFYPTEDTFIQLEPGTDIAIDIHWSSSGSWNVEPSLIGWIDEHVRNDILKECFSSAGEYTIKFVFENNLNEYFELTDDKGHGKIVKVAAWTGKVSSNELKIKVKR